MSALADPRLSDDQRDCLQEVMNVAMGQAGDALARFLSTFIHLSVPTIRIVESDQLIHTLREVIRHLVEPSAVRQGFQAAEGSPGIFGEAISLFGGEGYRGVGTLLNLDDAGDSESEVLLDLSNLMFGTCMNGVAEQLGAQFTYSPPSLLGRHNAVDEMVAQKRGSWDLTLLVELTYRLENRPFVCYLLLMMPRVAMMRMMQIADRLLEEL